MKDEDWKFEDTLTTALAYTQEAQRHMCRAGIKGWVSSQMRGQIAFQLREAAAKIEGLSALKGTGDER